MKNRTFFVISALAAAAFGAGLLLPPGPAYAEQDQADPTAFVRGAKAWAENCARCHNMRDPKEFRDDLWRPIVYHMRVRGGLTGQETRDILLFLQASNFSLPVARVALVGPSSAAGDQGRGEIVYSGTCIACHGADGTGNLPGVPDLTEKDGALWQEDPVLITRMVNGFQTPGSPMAMPPRGGNPALTDADMKAALEYMHRKFQRAR
jgi:mono/diheme cytochrome c family protein